MYLEYMLYVLYAAHHTSYFLSARQVPPACHTPGRVVGPPLGTAVLCSPASGVTAPEGTRLKDSDPRGRGQAAPGGRSKLGRGPRA